MPASFAPSAEEQKSFQKISEGYSLSITGGVFGWELTFRNEMDSVSREEEGVALACFASSHL